MWSRDSGTYARGIPSPPSVQPDSAQAPASQAITINRVALAMDDRGRACTRPREALSGDIAFSSQARREAAY
ncbi:hypothetical protein GCM10028862_03680 [Luteimonas pelagia]